MTRFNEIVGQSGAVETLGKAYGLNRLPHGLIFAGPTGVGKETTARALAGLFLCEKPKDLAPCGKCASCQAFDADAHPDFHLIYRQLIRFEKKDSVAKALSIEVIREFLLDKAAHSSVIGVGKVFVVRESDLMSTAAQNSLLKVLEEPASRTLIILLTDSPESLLPTIRSRCQLVRFAPLDEKVVRQQLEKRGTARELAAKAARFADGSLGLAMAWIEDGVIERATQLSQMLGKIAAGGSAGPLQSWLKSAVEEYTEKQIDRDKNASTDQAKREGLVLYLKLAAQELRAGLREREDDPAAMERLCAAIDSLARSEGYVEANVNIALVLQQLTGALDRALHPALT